MEIIILTIIVVALVVAFLIINAVFNRDSDIQTTKFRIDITKWAHISIETKSQKKNTSKKATCESSKKVNRSKRHGRGISLGQ